jgi:hypothetical protein
MYLKCCLIIIDMYHSKYKCSSTQFNSDQWFSGPRQLMLHITTCRTKHCDISKQDSDSIILYPLMSMHSINRYNTSVNGAMTDNSATFSVNSKTCDDPQFDDNFDYNKDINDNERTEFNSLLDSSESDQQSSEDNLQNNDTHGTCHVLTH